ncbi:hypothetical protein [Butyricicoccus sp. Marseille-Q5471]|uniref:hypothetical protein n=1 Tax=Butyricicoccus sp. Marseille-Q5471 TaxID=3039493 RepID=UPI0024BD549E|nr:hypothetical protein [Butyricicoccus sp. Marseille-Q5471]
MMTASRESVAYQLYEERFVPARRETRRELRSVSSNEVPPQQERESKQSREPKQPRRRKKGVVRPDLMACIGIVAVVSVFILFCQMNLTQLTAEVAQTNEKLEELTAESVSLTTKQTYNLNMDEIEAKAVGLGMVKMDNAQIEYVELTNPDSITVKESGVSLNALFSGLAKSFSAVVEYIR